MTHVATFYCCCPLFCATLPSEPSVPCDTIRSHKTPAPFQSIFSQLEYTVYFCLFDSLVVCYFAMLSSTLQSLLVLGWGIVQFGLPPKHELATIPDCHGYWYVTYGNKTGMIFRSMWETWWRLWRSMKEWFMWKFGHVWGVGVNDSSVIAWLDQQVTGVGEGFLAATCNVCLHGIDLIWSKDCG